MNVRHILTYALQREREGKRFFEENAGRMAHAAAASIFRQLAEEEQRHVDYIQALLRRLAASDGVDDALPAPDPEPDVGPDSLFTARAVVEHLDQSVIESMIPDVAVLRTAYLIERDFAELYETAAERAEGQAKDALLALARWERGHERLFQELHDRVFDMYAGMPWGG